MREASTASHRKDGAKRRALVNVRTRQVRETNRARVYALLAAATCADCPMTGAEVMEFDHRPGSGKAMSVSDLVTKSFAWERIAAEIAKCDIVCANCHRRRTILRRPTPTRPSDPLRVLHKAKIRDLLSSLTCADCPEADPDVMEFDHLDPSLKVAAISNMVGRVSWRRIEEEIAKCDVVCANCHRRRTALRGNHHHIRQSLQASTP